ncbi:hypothetical protein, partial [Peptostreptococcus anaerobius]|uniref:hypothetical protein n=1 Tax=Peptostreptococcus anaerobius TaxID=1261 RepID=UPI001A9BD435
MSTTNFSLIFRLLNLYLKFSNQSQSNWGFYSYNKKTLDKLESFLVLCQLALMNKIYAAASLIHSVSSML